MNNLWKIVGLCTSKILGKRLGKQNTGNLPTIGNPGYRLCCRGAGQHIQRTQCRCRRLSGSFFFQWQQNHHDIGGMLTSEDSIFIEKARFFSQQARDDAPHYEHSQIGFNYRMSNILATIGRRQIHISDDKVQTKRKIFAKNIAAIQDIDGIEFMPGVPFGKSSRWLTVILISPEKFGTDRETVLKALEAENIEARSVWKPMDMQPVFDCQPNCQDAKRPGCWNAEAWKKLKKRYKARAIGGLVAEDLFDRDLCLPSGTAMREPDIERVCTIIHFCCRR